MYVVPQCATPFAARLFRGWAALLGFDPHVKRCFSRSCSPPGLLSGRLEQANPTNWPLNLAATGLLPSPSPVQRTFSADR